MTESATVSILVVEDFKEWREEIRRILQARPDWKIVYEACDGPDGVQKAAEPQPRIVLLDMGLPTLNGIEAARIIFQRSPKSRIIFLTETTDSEIRSAAMSTGASGYVIKSNAAHELLDAIAAALRDPWPAASSAQPR
jgi:DNA-binding NarL/FixJ family response regulator